MDSFQRLYRNFTKNGRVVYIHDFSARGVCGILGEERKRGRRHTVPQMKYEKHNARQYEQILRAARQLFVEKGIERVSFSAVADPVIPI